jgi:HTH-type transcriptional regulator / antitoxin HigA
MATQTAPDAYTKLVRQFRLVQIKDDEHLQAAHEMIERLLQEDLEAPGQDYLNVSAELVESYEDQRFPITDASEADVLRELMRSNGLSQNSLAKKVGISQSTISAVLSGKRSLTKDHVVKLAKLLNIATAAFLPGGPSKELGNWPSGTAPANESSSGIAAASQS